MPNPPAHVAIAFRLADRLQEPRLERYKGALLLGSTAPDSRAMTRQDRDDTHFAPLTSTDLQEGVRGLFAVHGHLSPLSRLPEPTQAFLLGYISHLVADQAWITMMYRPFFQDPDRFPNQATANVMDRALQLEMDRRAAPRVGEARTLLGQAEEGVDIGFIDGPTLTAWREWVEGRFSQEFSWERLRFMAHRRQDPESMEIAEQVAQRFMDAVPEGLADLNAVVPWEQVEAYQALVLEQTERLARRLLICE